MNYGSKKRGQVDYTNTAYNQYNNSEILKKEITGALSNKHRTGWLVKSRAAADSVQKTN